MAVVADRLVPRPAGRMLGVTAQLYQLAGRRSWGLGDVGDLMRLLSWVGRVGGLDFLLLNPLCAAEPVPPVTASPYTPVSREFLNPACIWLDQVLDSLLDAGPTAQDAALRAVVEDLGRPVRGPRADGRLADRDEAWSAKSKALWIIWTHIRQRSDVRARVEQIRRQRPDVDDFATWCALAQRFGTDASRWPTSLRRPGSAAEQFARREADTVKFHIWLQATIQDQVRAAHRFARAGGSRIGLVLDLPVGFSPTGAEAWQHHDDLAPGVWVGAPPDDYNPNGQNWNLRPYRPHALARSGFAPLRRALRSICEVAGGVRIDHVKGLDRSWWIPDGADPVDGAYVRQDLQGALAVIAVEAMRSGSVVIAEDMSPRETGLHQALADHGMLGTSTVWLEKTTEGMPIPAGMWRSDVMASIGTHDLPPTAPYLRGEHLSVQGRIGSLVGSPVDAYSGHEQRISRLFALVARELNEERLLDPRQLTDDELLSALHRYLLATPALLVAVQLCDIAGERRAINYPGTDSEYPNWRLALTDSVGRPVDLDALPVPVWLTTMLAEHRAPEGRPADAVEGPWIGGRQ